MSEHSLYVLSPTRRKTENGASFSYPPTPLSYVRDNGTVCLLSAQSTVWWMNLREEGTPVSILIASETLTGKARLWEGDSEALRERVTRYLTALPRDAKVYGIKLDESNKPIEESLPGRPYRC